MRTLLAVAFLLTATPALAAEPESCTKAKWDLSQERALLAAPDKAASSGLLDRNLTKAIAVKLVPLKEAGLVIAPERAPKNPASLGAVLKFKAGDEARTYQITLSGAAWIDVVQDNAYVKSGAFTDLHGCIGLRKSVRFTIQPAPFTVQLSDAPSDMLALVITPAN